MINGLPFGIGSMPHTDHKKACREILKFFPMSPFWPELPKRDWRESMGIEQARSLPGFVIDNQNQKVFFDRERDIAAELGQFYQSFLDGKLTTQSISEEFLPGLVSMISEIESSQAAPVSLKGQLTGPTTLGLILKDRAGNALLYDEQMMDVLVKGTNMKAKWMLGLMKDHCEHPVVFFDEPMLQSVGSATVPIDRDLAVKRLAEAIDGVDCVTGGHCCGNTDWSILIEAGLSVIAFDSWQYGETIALYPDELRMHVERGGYLAWGIVPASSKGADIGMDVLTDKLVSTIEKTSETCDIPFETLIGRSIATPSCGMGSLSESQASSILEKTARICEDVFTAG